jgi:two-component system, cell cycle sensor histidine kinase and response regulator CckA
MHSSIRAAFLKNIMLVTTASVVLLFALWMLREYRQFDRDAATARKVFVEDQKRLLQKEVGAVVEYIDYTRERTEEVLRRQVRDRVYEAHSIASHLHRFYGGRKTPAEVGGLIRESLRHLRFNNGRGYYFIFDENGVEVLFADRPELEGKNMLALQGARGEYVVRDMLALVSGEGEGFYDYTWTKPGEAGNAFEKTAFVKSFAPYGWVIGTGEYFDDVRDDLQQQVLQRLITLRFGEEGYFFGSIRGGLPLFTRGRITQGNQSLWDVVDPNGIKIFQEYERAIANPGGGFVRYSWQKLDSIDPVEKISYVTAIKGWPWIIGAGAYLDTVEKELADKKRVLFARFLKQAGMAVAVLALLLVASFLVGWKLSGRIRSSLDTFIDFCRRAARERVVIDPTTLQFSELQDIALATNEMLDGQRQAMERLVQSEGKYRTLFENMVHGVFYQQADGRLVDVNPAALKIFGLSREEFLGRSGEHPSWQVIDESGTELPAAAQPSMVALSSGRPVLNSVVGVFSHRRNGFVWLTINAIPQFRAEEVRPFQVFVTLSDITRRKEAEEERARLLGHLQQVQRLEAIGTLAGGIAHDFNNILGAILGYAEMAREGAPENSRVAADLAEVITACLRAKELVKQILAFSRQSGAERICLRPAEGVGEAVKLLRPSLPATIDIVQKIDANAGPIFADPTQLHQVLVNLCTNAFHAMEERGGTLTITLRNVGQDELPEEVQKSGAYACLTVGDSGPGMTPEVMARMFEPYFTTKEVGKGTGMGLAIVHGIVTGYDGFVRCRSTPGEGATIEVYLPVIAGDLPAVEEAQQPVPTGRERILLVDDERILAEMSEIMLRRLGYRVTSVASGPEAIAAFLKEPKAYDLVLTDQTMPGMTGLDLARRLLELRPGLPIILCTGYSTQVSSESATAAGIRAFAMKPLAKREIATLVRRVLDEAVVKG